jgi:hypothetical protein
MSSGCGPAALFLDNDQIDSLNFSLGIEASSLARFGDVYKTGIWRMSDSEEPPALVASATFIKQGEFGRRCPYAIWLAINNGVWVSSPFNRW